ncbi:MAG: mandelate racemase/muconate lactonizing enzyme family protein [Rhizobiaceae bacterium]|nr:mandelate racemase/muconate lactonizing enzyme family protein [Rhizobiaceae bacterium]
MKVTALETIYVDEHPNLLWVQVHTDEGPVGLGETYFGADAVEAHIHEFVAPYLLGQDPLHIERHAQRMTGYAGRGGSGAEMRGTSAVEIALWDIWGQFVDQPIYQLLGGASRDSVRVYNTCAGYQYVRKAPAQTTANFGLDSKAGPYEDLEGFLHRADEVAHSLLEMGINAMKIWPFDFAAEASGGTYISNQDLKKAIQPFEKIRHAVGDKMEIMAELHSLWNVPTARRIAEALEEFDLTWIEDPVRMDDPSQAAAICDAVQTPIAGGELLGQRYQFKQLVEQARMGVVIMDLVWGGGLSEGRKVASLCDSHGIPFAAHDCTGPVALTASTHLALHAPNMFIQEVVRAFYYGWYGELVTQLPPIEDGFIKAPTGPGLGIALNPDITKRKDARTRRSD